MCLLPSGSLGQKTASQRLVESTYTHKTLSPTWRLSGPVIWLFFTSYLLVLRSYSDFEHMSRTAGSAFGSTARAGVIARQNGSGPEEATADRYMKEVLHVAAQ